MGSYDIENAKLGGSHTLKYGADILHLEPGPPLSPTCVRHLAAAAARAYSDNDYERNLYDPLLCGIIATLSCSTVEIIGRSGPDVRDWVAVELAYNPFSLFILALKRRDICKHEENQVRSRHIEDLIFGFQG